MSLIDPMGLKESLAISSILMDGKTLEQIIDEQPTIEERKTGRWIQFPSHNAYKCSECGRVIETTDGKNNVCKHYPYCHCGAKMEVEHDQVSD